MAKISKRLLNKHNEAIELLKLEKLDYNQREFVFDHFHEGAGNMNNLISAHFTPYEIAKSMTFCITYNECFVDLCAGIGMLSYVLLRQNEMGFERGVKPFGICIEKSTEYYEVGKKLLPDFHWINGDCFDPVIIAEVKALMKDRQFSIISNPPYGKQVKTQTKDLLKYVGANFEYKAIEWGAIVGAYDGAFLLPQNVCPFRMTGSRKEGVYSESYKTTEYNKFVDNTGLKISSNMGFSTDLIDEDLAGWKDVSIITEIAIIEYDELNYKPIKHDLDDKITENVTQEQTELIF